MISVTNSPSLISLQSRDLALFRALFESRIMTTAHVAILHFDGSREAAKKRIQKLKGAGYLSERTRRVNEPSVLFLAPKAFDTLRDEGILQSYPQIPVSSLIKRSQVKDATLRHELDVMDIKSGFHATARRNPSLMVAQFTTWPLLSQFNVSMNGRPLDVRVKPDGFVRIHEQTQDGRFEHTFYLEADRSSEALDVLVTKALCYGAHYRSGGFAVNQGGTRDRFKEYPFRVLMVFKSAERRNNVAERLIQSTPPVLTQVCLSTFDEVTSNPFGLVWIQPKDYRDATLGTPFDPSRSRPHGTYRTHSERQAFVEARIKKIPLLQD